MQFKNGTPRIIILGAYGQVGVALLRLFKKHLPDPQYILAGRDRTRLKAIADRNDRVCTLDVGDPESLRAAVREADLAINCIGPYLKYGHEIARTCVASGTAYFDPASEQEHYVRMQRLNSAAHHSGVPIMTGLGSYPGLSGLILLHLLRSNPDEYTEARMYVATGNTTGPDAGLASYMTAVLEYNYKLRELHDGDLREVHPGREICQVELPEPFGKMKLLNWPQMEILSLAKLTALSSLRTFIGLGHSETPSRLQIGLIRLLRPHRFERSYQLLKAIARRRLRSEYQKAQAVDPGTAAVLQIELLNQERRSIRANALLPDMATGTALLPLYASECWLRGTILPGWHDPLELFDTADALNRIRRIEPGIDPS